MGQCNNVNARAPLVLVHCWGGGGEQDGDDCAPPTHPIDTARSLAHFLCLWQCRLSIQCYCNKPEYSWVIWHFYTFRNLKTGLIGDVPSAHVDCTCSLLCSYTFNAHIPYTYLLTYWFIDIDLLHSTNRCNCWNGPFFITPRLLMYKIFDNVVFAWIATPR